MANKSYNQFCSIAHALDLIGDRWTLLVVRNLLLGPRRFSDLMKGLPGISTNILTDRLKALEENQLIQTRYLPPPAASTVYELTQDGYALTDVLAVLARWGSKSLGAPQSEQAMVTEAIAFMVIGMFYRTETPEITLACNVHVQDAHYEHTFGIALSPDGAQMSEDMLTNAALTLTVALDPLVPLSSKQTRLQDAIAAGTVQLDGDMAARDALIAWVDMI